MGQKLPDCTILVQQHCHFVVLCHIVCIANTHSLISSDTYCSLPYTPNVLGYQKEIPFLQEYYPHHINNKEEYLLETSLLILPTRLFVHPYQTQK